MVGKYTQLNDAYLSVIEALHHGGAHHGGKIEIKWVDSERLEPASIADELEGLDGILVPGGFGVRGVEGKILAARYARERGVPYLGICLGMQVAVAEFARHMAGMDGANSTEFDPETPFPVIDLLPEQKEVRDMGGTMRLGADPGEAPRRHARAGDLRRGRHLRAPPPPLRGQQPPRRRLEQEGLVCSGTSPDDRLVEIIEITDHPFFVASQFHPEFKSRPLRPQPLFRDFVGAATARAREGAPDVGAVSARRGRGAAAPDSHAVVAGDAGRARAAAGGLRPAL